MTQENLSNSPSGEPHSLPLTKTDELDLALLERAQPGEIETLIADGGDDRIDTLYLENPSTDVLKAVNAGKNLARIKLADTAPVQEHFTIRR